MTIKAVLQVQDHPFRTRLAPILQQRMKVRPQ